MSGAGAHAMGAGATVGLEHTFPAGAKAFLSRPMVVSYGSEQGETSIEHWWLIKGDDGRWRTEFGAPNRGYKDLTAIEERGYPVNLIEFEAEDGTLISEPWYSEIPDDPEPRPVPQPAPPAGRPGPDGPPEDSPDAPRADEPGGTSPDGESGAGWTAGKTLLAVLGVTGGTAALGFGAWWIARSTMR